MKIRNDRVLCGLSASILALSAAAPGTTAGVERYDLTVGKQVYERTCVACHGSGREGAPKTGDMAAWAARMDQGMEILIERATQGYEGERGFMPPKGGALDLTDAEVTAAVAYLVLKAGETGRR